MLNKFVISLFFILSLGACSSMTHYESIYIASADKHDGGIRAIRSLQRGEDQQCEISVTQKDPVIKDLNAEIWSVLVCNRYYQYRVTFEPQADDRYKVTATQFLGS